MGGWSYFATALAGDGTETLVAVDLPLSDVTINLALSAPTSLEASIPVEVDLPEQLQGSRTVIYAVLDGAIRGAGLLYDVDEGDAELGLSCRGWTAELAGQPWSGPSRNYILGDPMQIARDFWDGVQSVDGGDLCLDVVTEGTNPIRLGRQPVDQWPRIHSGYPGNPLLPEGTKFVVWWMEGSTRHEQYGTATRTYSYPSKSKDPEVVKNVQLLIRDRKDGSVQEDDTNEGPTPGFDVLGVVDARTQKPTAGQDGVELEPWPLTWFDVPDLGQRWDDLAKDGQLDYVEEHWGDLSADAKPGDVVNIRHTLRVAHPSIGRRRDDLRFKVGENVHVVPSIERDGDYYANVIEVRGTGEGAKQKHGSWSTAAPGRRRRVKVIQEPSLTSDDQCARRARALAPAYADESDVTALTVANTPSAPLGSYGVGDLITVEGSGLGWSGDLLMTVRVLGIALTPATGDMAVLKVTRADKVADQ